MQKAAFKKIAGMNEFRQYMNLISDARKRLIFINSMQVLGTKQELPSNICKIHGHTEPEVTEVLTTLEKIGMVERLDGGIFKASAWMFQVSPELYSQIGQLPVHEKISHFRSSLELQRDIIDKIIQYWNNSANVSAWFEATKQNDVDQLILMNFAGIPVSLAKGVADLMRSAEKQIHDHLGGNVKEGMEAEPPFQLLWLMVPFPLTLQFPIR